MIEQGVGQDFEKEREIRLQFLDEAAEYLDRLEAALLNVALSGVDLHEMNGALRAAHSIKGGAALMGYGLTSELAHRLEDSLKVLKIRRSEGVTSEVEALLLKGVDAIRQVVERDRLNTPLDEAWVSGSVLPIFDALYDTFGEPSPEDASDLMEADDGQNVMPLIFQTEVESTLERLELLIDERSVDDLQTELITMAQELSGLGEMLDLSPFSQLCGSVEQYATCASTNEQKQEVTTKALQAWRRAQALVLTGNEVSMPTQLTQMSFGVSDSELGAIASTPYTTGVEEFEGCEDTSAAAVFAGFDIDTDDLPLDESNWDNLSAASLDTTDLDATDLDATDLDKTDFNATDFDETDYGAEDEALVGDVFASLGDEDASLVADVFSAADSNDDPVDPFANVFIDDLSTDSSAGSTAQSGFTTSPQAATKRNSGTEFRFSEAPQSKADEADVSDNTVRVSVRKLNELNDYFGELTIERNRLEAEVKRMRSLVKDLNRKLRSLDEINDDVREVYEQPDSPFNNPLLLAGSKDVHPSVSSVTPHSISDLPARFRQNFDTLEFDRYNDTHLPFRQIVESVVKLQEVADDIELSVDRTEQTARVLNRTARHLQRNLNQLRLRPLSDVTNRFPRALRELELAHHKSVELVLEGETLLVDRNILEALSDPLMHIVRNAFDHGIETPQKREAQGKPPIGTIAIRAFNRSNRTVITVSDDGNGIGLEKIRDRALSMGLDSDLLSSASESDLLSLIFEPGFSTAHEVTALSGRGVGMDVVRNNLTQIRGDISVDTAAGKGTTFTLSVPYTLSVTRVMLAESNQMLVALPTDMIEEVTIVAPESLYNTEEAEGREMFAFKGDNIRLIRLSNWLSFNCPRQFETLEETPSMDRASVLIFRMGDQRMGLEIERSWGEQEVAVRRVEGPIALPAGFSNCTILGDGKVVPLMSLPDLARWVLNCEGSNINSAEALFSNPVMQGSIDPVSLQTLPDPSPQQRSRFLVIDDSLNVRRLLALTLEKAGYEVEQARDGQDALDRLAAGLAIDSIICDVEMPRMDGYSFLSKLRAQPQYADIPVTMLTSRSGEKHRTLAMNLGATAYFSKPYQERVLLKSLEETLAAAAQ